MKIIHFRLLVPGPCRPSEPGSPVIGHTALPWLLPYIIIPIRVFPALFTLLKPGMLIRCMVDHQIHHQLHPQLMYLQKQGVKILHGSKFRHNCLIVTDIVPIIIIRRLIDRRQPDHIHSQLLQVAQSLPDSVQIPDPVPIAVLKASGIDLIHQAVLPPFSSPFHSNYSFLILSR